MWQGKKYVKVFQPTKECKLGLSELLVYSYYAYQDAFDTTPGIMQVVRGVGLSKDTVRRARERLERLGLYADTVQPPADGMFYPAERKNPTHWRDNYAYWHYYVRSPDSPLTTLQVAVLSFLWHLRHTSPGFRLSIRFVALLLRAKRDSVRTALDVLQAEGFLTYTTSANKRRGGVKVSLRPLTPEDMRHFQDVGGDNETEQITLSGAEIDDPLEVLRYEVARIFEDEKYVPKIERAIVATPAWTRDKANVLRYCRRFPTGDEGVQQLCDTIKMSWRVMAG